MCSITAGLMAASAVMGAYGQHQDAKAQAAAARAQADAAEQNAKIENRKQELIADKYAQEDMKRRAQARIIQGRNVANAGAAGLDTGVGTSVWDIMSSSEEAFQRDRNLSLQNQRQENWVSRQNEANFLSQASAYRAQADNIKRNANMGIAATILGTAAAISGKVSSGSSKTPKTTSSSYSGTTSVNATTDANFTSGKGFSFTKKDYNYRDAYKKNAFF